MRANGTIPRPLVSFRYYYESGPSMDSLGYEAAGFRLETAPVLNIMAGHYVPTEAGQQVRVLTRLNTGDGSIFIESEQANTGLQGDTLSVIQRSSTFSEAANEYLIVPPEAVREWEDLTPAERLAVVGPYQSGEAHQSPEQIAANGLAAAANAVYPPNESAPYVPPAEGNYYVPPPQYVQPSQPTYVPPPPSSSGPSAQDIINAAQGAAQGAGQAVGAGVSGAEEYWQQQI